MRGVTNYKITCCKCGKSEKIGMINENVLWNDAKYIISARKRLDGNWGFECLNCGNNDLMTQQEKKTIKNHQQPEKKDIDAVIRNLVVQKPNFLMEPV